MLFKQSRAEQSRAEQSRAEQSRAEHDETGLTLPQGRYIGPVSLLLGNVLLLGKAARIQPCCAGSAATAKQSPRAELNFLMIDNRRT